MRVLEVVVAPLLGGAAVVGWCGMRGTVTLAAALALPTDGEGGGPFPSLSGSARSALGESAPLLL